MKLTISNAKNKLPEFRGEHGKTLKFVSEQTGVAVSTLISLEKGSVKPQATTVYKLNKYLKTFLEE